MGTHKWPGPDNKPCQEAVEIREGVAVRRYDSMEHIIAEAGRWGWYEHGEIGLGPSRSWFCNDFPSRESASQALLDGRTTATIREKAAELMGQIVTAMDACDLTGISAKRRRVFSDMGDEVDADRMNEHRSDCWRTMRRNKPARVIRIGFNCLMSWGNGADCYAEQAAMTCAVSDVLSRLGHAVEVVGMLAGQSPRVRLRDGRKPDNGGHGGYYAACVRLKAANEPLDLERIGSVGLRSFHHYVNRGARLIDWDCLGCNSFSAVIDDVQKFCAATEVDYLFTRSWFGMDQIQLYQGVMEVMGESAAAAAGV